LLWFGQAIATAEAMLLARRAELDLDVLRQALTSSAASSVFIRDHLGALLAGDLTIRMNGVRSARSVRSSSAAAEVNRSQKPAGRLLAGECSG
jgi:3-hydroxyisobutyrate dehydrogenase-like beta-hydroxyacid dehydrogenase